jgi:hypothetical protein
MTQGSIHRFEARTLVFLYVAESRLQREYPLFLRAGEVVSRASGAVPGNTVEYRLSGAAVRVRGNWEVCKKWWRYTGKAIGVRWGLEVSGEAKLKGKSDEIIAHRMVNMKGSCSLRVRTRSAG